MSSNNELSELRARRIVQTMNRLRAQVDLFATHAHMLRVSSKSLDGLPLMEEANHLLLALKGSQWDFQEAAMQTPSLSRSLPSQPGARGGIAPAAKWGNEFRAGSKHFIEAVHRAEGAIASLYRAADDKLMSPTRTPTGAPENAFDVVINFLDMLSRYLERTRAE